MFPEDVSVRETVVWRFLTRSDDLDRRKTNFGRIVLPLNIPSEI